MNNQTTAPALQMELERAPIARQVESAPAPEIAPEARTTFERDYFKTALDRLARAVGNSKHDDVLNYVEIEATSDRVKISATDRTTFATATLPASTHGTFKTLARFDLIREYIKHSENAPLTLAFFGEGARPQFRSGHSRLRLATLPSYVKEFPQRQEITGAARRSRVFSEQIAQALAAVLPFCPTRPDTYRDTIKFTVGAYEIECEASDGTRYKRASFRVDRDDTLPGNEEAPGAVFIPREFCAQVLKVCKAAHCSQLAHIEISAGAVHFDNYELQITAPTGQSWEAPPAFIGAATIKADAKHLLKLIRRLEPAAKPVKNRVEIKSVKPDPIKSSADAIIAARVDAANSAAEEMPGDRHHIGGRTGTPAHFDAITVNIKELRQAIESAGAVSSVWIEAGTVGNRRALSINGATVPQVETAAEEEAREKREAIAKAEREAAAKAQQEAEDTAARQTVTEAARRYAQKNADKIAQNFRDSAKRLAYSMPITDPNEIDAGAVISGIAINANVYDTLDEVPKFNSHENAYSIFYEVVKSEIAHQLSYSGDLTTNSGGELRLLRVYDLVPNDEQRTRRRAREIAAEIAPQRLAKLASLNRERIEAIIRAELEARGIMSVKEIAGLTTGERTKLEERARQVITEANDRARREATGEPEPEQQPKAKRQKLADKTDEELSAEIEAKRAAIQRTWGGARQSWKSYAAGPAKREKLQAEITKLQNEQARRSCQIEEETPAPIETPAPARQAKARKSAPASDQLPLIEDEAEQPAPIETPAPGDTLPGETMPNDEIYNDLTPQPQKTISFRNGSQISFTPGQAPQGSTPPPRLPTQQQRGAELRLMQQIGEARRRALSRPVLLSSDKHAGLRKEIAQARRQLHSLNEIEAELFAEFARREYSPLARLISQAEADQREAQQRAAIRPPRLSYGDPLRDAGITVYPRPLMAPHYGIGPAAREIEARGVEVWQRPHRGPYIYRPPELEEQQQRQYIANLLGVSEAEAGQLLADFRVRFRRNAEINPITPGQIVTLNIGEDQGEAQPENEPPGQARPPPAVLSLYGRGIFLKILTIHAPSFPKNCGQDF